MLYSRVGYVAGIGINTFGFAQKLGGENGENAISLNLTSFNYGNIIRTTVDQPDGGLGTFRISTSILSAAYARRFTDKIYGGIQFKMYSQGIADVKATALAIDAGVQYATTTNPTSIKQNDLRFGVSVKDIGPDFRPAGDGLSFKSFLAGKDYQTTTNLRAAKIELPTSINIVIRKWSHKAYKPIQSKQSKGSILKYMKVHKAVPNKKGVYENFQLKGNLTDNMRVSN